MSQIVERKRVYNLNKDKSSVIWALLWCEEYNLFLQICKKICKSYRLIIINKFSFFL